MKKRLLILFIICLMFSLVGCAPDPGPSGENTDPSSSTSTTSTEPSTKPSGSTVSQAPLVSVSVPVITESAKAEDGTVIFNYTYQNMSLIHPDPDVADIVIVDFLNRIDNTSKDAESILSRAQADYNGSSSWNPYLCLIAYDPMRIDQGILSLFGSYATYTGTTHPETVYMTANYDLVTGKTLTLGDILTEDASKDTLYQYVIDSLTSQKEEKSLRTGFEETVKDRFSGNINSNEAWYFSQTGLCFYFVPYEIAPYGSGVVVAEIPYEKLAGIMDDAYFPAERDTVSGVVSAQLFTEADLDSFTQFAELVLDADGDNILLHTENAVHNITIEIGTWSASGAYFTSQHTIFAASSLTPGDAIMVETALLNAMPDLKLNYQSGDKTFSFYIAQSEDGSSVQLIPA